MGGLSLDYPAAWQSIVVGRPLHYETILAFLTGGTASADETCGPDYVPGMGNDCTEADVLPAESAIVKLSTMDGPPTPHGAVAWAVAGGWAAVTVAGQPAAFSTTSDPEARIPGSDLTMAWLIAAPGSDIQFSYAITASLRGPDLAGLRAQIDALIATIQLRQPDS